MFMNILFFVLSQQFFTIYPRTTKTEFDELGSSPEHFLTVIDFISGQQIIPKPRLRISWVEHLSVSQFTQTVPLQYEFDMSPLL
jgi:hypothetical protein